MSRARVTLETTLYGKRLVSVDDLYQLHAEVSRAATIARMKHDPRYRENQATGYAISRARLLPPVTA